MLVIGITDTAHPIHSDIDIDLSTDSPRKIVDTLAKATHNKLPIVQVMCIENDEVIESFQDGVDYDLDEDADAVTEDDVELSEGNDDDFELDDE